MRPIAEIEDLRWLVRDSDSELGKRAQAIHPTSHIASASSDFGWGEREFAAARRKKDITEVLAHLTPRQVCVIEVAYESRARFTAVGADHESMAPEDRARLSLAAPVVRKVRLEYQQAYATAERHMRKCMCIEKHARDSGDAERIVAAKAKLSESRHELRGIKEAAAEAEREGVQLLRDAHKAYLAARKLVRSRKRGERKERKAKLLERARARKAEGIALGKEMRSLHDDEVDDIVRGLRACGLGRAYGDGAAAWMDSMMGR